jgi:hypothetical protein
VRVAALLETTTGDCCASPNPEAGRLPREKERNMSSIRPRLRTLVLHSEIMWQRVAAPAVMADQGSAQMGLAP